MKLSDCKPGARVRYWPVRGQGPFYDGTVREEPWELGSGDWVTHLKDVNRPEKPYVHAALVDWLFLLELAPSVKESKS